MEERKTLENEIKQTHKIQVQMLYVIIGFIGHKITVKLLYRFLNTVSTLTSYLISTGYFRWPGARDQPSGISFQLPAWKPQGLAENHKHSA